jgi:hypothetical protein
MNPETKNTEPGPRIARELKTVQKMIELYCRDHHGSKSGACGSCRLLADYAERRLLLCPFQENKTTCSKCAVHCYKPEYKRKIIEVMRYAGPRMMLHHPVLAVYHLVDERRSAPRESGSTPLQPSKRKK